ncbi:sporulation minus regulator 2 [Triangularia verruculosa]|uniref:Sporulation minus regulator 2 n=1 Tax=Triangularia verruculosa TaxID=2587418 RepID=A0AAN7AVL1_9PEZI|nr:sporulation minus regulator 2 [Triangularia verruculosa]
MDATNSISNDAPVWYFDKMDIPLITDSNLFSFIFIDGETVVQHIAASNVYEDEVVSSLTVAAVNFSKMNDGLDSAIVHRKESTHYYILTFSLAFRLDTNIFDVLYTTMPTPELVATPASVTTPILAPVMIPAMASVSAGSGNDTMYPNAETAVKGHIRRPRNQFIIYRQYMSKQLHQETPGLTAGTISSIVSKAWKSETPQVRAHFKALAEEEDRLHKLNHPGYRYSARRRIQRRRIDNTAKALAQYPAEAMSPATVTDLDNVLMNLGHSHI